MGTMVVEQRREIDVAHAVAVSQHESFAFEPFGNSFDAAASRSLEACVDEIHVPVGALAIVYANLAGAERNGQVAGVVAVAKKVLLDDIAPVTQGNDKVLESVVAVHLHDVPDDRKATHRHHGFRLDACLFGKAAAEASGENDNLQRAALVIE